MKLAIPLGNAMIRNILLVCVADLIVGVSLGRWRMPTVFRSGYR